MSKRVETIIERYGPDAFRVWGKGTPSRPGGNPVIALYKAGKLTKRQTY
jgi:hypothetical protein